jgi:hypothetical protein
VVLATGKTAQLGESLSFATPRTHYVWSDLTATGNDIVASLLYVPQVREVAVRERYFSLTLKQEHADEALRCWEQVLRTTVGLIRSIAAPGAPVCRVSPVDRRLKRSDEWHLPLLERLF